MPLIQVTDNLAFGDVSVCTHPSNGEMAVVHACKEPCHRHAVGYATQTIPKTHPNYLVKETPFNLYLNLIDPPQPLFQVDSFVTFFTFVDKHIGQRRVLIHCNKGESRAPSLSLLYLAKRTTLLPNESYIAAAEAFRSKIYPTYYPGQGIITWLRQHWDDLGC